MNYPAHRELDFSVAQITQRIDELNENHRILAGKHGRLREEFDLLSHQQHEITSRLAELSESLRRSDLATQSLTNQLQQLHRKRYLLQKRLDERKPPPTPVEERRQHKRYAIAIDVTFLAGDRILSGYSENISLGGMLLATLDPMPMGACLELSFRMPGSPVMIETRASVCWLRPARVDDPGSIPAMGLRFEDLDKQQAEIIQEYIISSYLVPLPERP